MYKPIKLFLYITLTISFSFANLFFSEYAEGSSNNKYLEIYNASNESIDLAQYAFPNSTNGADVLGTYDYWNAFDEGTSVSAGDVYVICHGSSDDFIQAECDQFHTYLSNGDDGFCLVQGGDWNDADADGDVDDGEMTGFDVIDCIGDWNEDPGSGWEVAGVSNGTKDHTLVRKDSVNQGNSGDWTNSAGTSESDSEWVVLSQNDWTYLGSHPHAFDGSADDGGGDGGDDGGTADGSCAEYGCVGYTPENACQCNDLCVEYDNCCSDFIDVCGDPELETEICDDGIDNDGDTYIDCDDWNCNGEIGDADPACSGTDGGGDTGGTSGESDCSNGLDDDGDGFIDCNDFDCGGDSACPDEICDDGIDNDGNGYADCDDWSCNGGPDGDWEIDPACSGSDGGDGGTGDGGSEPVDADNLFFSEYAEGSSNNKYLEIYNAGDTDVDLSLYSLSSCANGCNDGSSWDYPNNITFDTGTTVASGDVFVVCHGSADATIIAECDQYFTYLSNGDDVYGLTQVSTGGILDIIGTIGDDPGNGWDVAGVTDATKDHTLVRKSTVLTGNFGNWASSAGTNMDNSEWEVYDQNTWDYLGSHDQGCNSTFGCTDSSAYNYDSCAEVDDGTCIYEEEVSIFAIQGSQDTSPYSGYPISTNGIVTGVNYAGFYMQDSAGGLWSGIWVYAQSLENFANVAVGDEVNVAGIVEEFFGLTEIEANNLVIASSGNELPDPVLISTGDFGEAHEGVLVSFENAACETDVNEYGEWNANDGTGSALVDDKLNSFNPVVGQNYNITGIGDYGFDVYRLQATSLDFPDGFPFADAGEDQTVEYGSVVVLDGSSSYDSDGYIVGYQWTQTSGISVNISDFEVAEISFIAPSQFSILTFALEVFDNDGNTSTDFVSVFVGEQSIYDIQFSSDQGGGDDCYPSQLNGEIINIDGIVTAVKDFSSYPNFFIQDPNLSEWGGVYVYVGEMDALSIGDEVNFNAEIAEYYGVTELKDVTDMQLISSGNPTVATSIATGDLGLSCGSGEMYEGMLVEFTNLTVESVDSEYNSIYVNDGSGTAKLDDYFFNFDFGFWPELAVGDTIDSATGVVHYYFGEYVVYPRDLSDMEGLDGGSTDPVATSIYDIQFSSDQGSGEDCYPSSISGQTVNVTGTVTSVKSFSSSPSFFIQDASLSQWGGVYVYVSESDPLSVGDEVNFNAEIDEYYGVTELKNLAGLELISSGNAAVATSIATGDLGLACGTGEMYEGMFIEFTNLTVESVDAQYSSIYVNDGSGTAKLDDYFFNFNDSNGELLGYWPELSAGDTIDSVVGTVHYYFGDYVVYPRNINDFNSSQDGCTANGDANGDGTVNVVDIVNIVAFVLGTASPTDEQACLSDVNGDGTVNVVDIVVIVNDILN